MTWLGIFAPRATPAATVDRLDREIRSVMHEDRISQRIAQLGGAVPDADRNAFSAFVQRDYMLSARLVQDLHLKLDP